MKQRLTLGELGILFAIGAAVGLIGDAGNVDSGATRYIDDSLPTVWESALWFPVLVGLGTASLGPLRLALGPIRPGFDPRIAIGGIASVVALYGLTSLIWDVSETASIPLMAGLAVLIACWLADRPGIICGIVAMVAGPLAEIVIIQLDLAEYAEATDSLFGVALWLVPLYFAAGVATARVTELLVARRTQG